MNGMFEENMIILDFPSSPDITPNIFFKEMPTPSTVEKSIQEEEEEGKEERKEREEDIETSSIISKKIFKRKKSGKEIDDDTKAKLVKGIKKGKTLFAVANLNKVKYSSAKTALDGSKARFRLFRTRKSKLSKVAETNDDKKGNEKEEALLPNPQDDPENPSDRKDELSPPKAEQMVLKEKRKTVGLKKTYKNRSYRKLDNETKKKLIEDYQRGKKIADLAKEYDINYHTVHSVVLLYRKSGRTFEMEPEKPEQEQEQEQEPEPEQTQEFRDNRDKVNDEVKIKLIEDYQKGVKARALAERYNVKLSTARTIIHVFQTEKRAISKWHKDKYNKVIEISQEGQQIQTYSKRVVKPDLEVAEIPIRKKSVCTKKSYDQIDEEEKIKIVEAIKNGDNVYALAEQYNIHYASVKKVWMNLIKKGEVPRKK